MGTFIVLEGGEGCGKSTQARILYDRLLQEGLPSALLHEPGGTSLGDEIRYILKSQSGARQSGQHVKSISPLTELLLFSAARAELISNIIHPTLEEGGTVICDRYTPSTIAYQGYGRGIPLETIERINRLASGGLEPELIILLDLPPEDGLSRVMARISIALHADAAPASRHMDEEQRDRFEEEPISFHRRVHAGYLEMAKADPGRWLVVDGSLPEEQIAEIVWQKVGFLVRSRSSGAGHPN